MRTIVSTVSVMLLFFVAGCTTPQAVHDSLALVKENVQIQKRITDTLLKSVVPQNDAQIEALAMRRLEVEQQYDLIAASVNRLIMYYQSEQYVDYIINIINFMQESDLRAIIGQAGAERNR